ncbi:polymorphic toxin-type HINT domain-containing protein [Streptomyces albidoflavus]|uniref:polymorphic toxin-type HINT domain-containing protein n=1 Tax=Streptomyces albidoflavus TaxID=1886 RepID=UPI0033A9486C
MALSVTVPRAIPSGPHLNTWIDAADLTTGQYLQTSAGTRIQITAITQRATQATVHNLTVAGTHTYYVVAGISPVLVHNCGEADNYTAGGHELRGRLKGFAGE